MILLFLIQLGFSQQPANNAAKPSEQASEQQAVELTQSSVPPLVSDIIEKYRYRSEGKSDPFKPYVSPNVVNYAKEKMQGPLLPLQKYDLDQLKLVGVIWGGNKPMAMISDSNNKIYYVKENDKIGNSNGYVAKIREGEIVVIETVLDEYGNREYVTKVMQIENKAK